MHRIWKDSAKTVGKIGLRTPLLIVLAVGSARALPSAGTQATPAGNGKVFRGSFAVTGLTDDAKSTRCSFEVKFEAKGDIVELGKASLAGSHCITTANPRPFLPAYDGRAVMTLDAASEIHVSYGITDLTAPEPLQVTTGKFTITGGTGRYQFATGGGTVTSKTDKSTSTWVSSIAFDGRLTLPQ